METLCSTSEKNHCLSEESEHHGTIEHPTAKRLERSDVLGTNSATELSSKLQLLLH